MGTPGIWQRRVAGLLALVAAAATGACGPAPVNVSEGGTSDGADPSVGLLAIAVTPAMQNVVLTVGTPATAGFQAMGTYLDGTTRNVTSVALWTLDQPQLGTITSGVFTSAPNQAGVAHVAATIGGITGTALLTVKAQLSRVESGAPTNAPTLFSGASPSAALAPTIVYPYDKVLVPQNLDQLEVQWDGLGGDNLYEVSIESTLTDIHIYTTQPKYPFEPDVWPIVASANRDSSVTITVAGMVSSAPAQAGTSAPVQVSFAHEAVQGGLYYWSASGCDPTKEGVFRYDFTAGGSGTAFYTKALASGHCVACHVLSSDGSEMLVTYDGGNGAAGDVTVKTVTPVFDWNAGIHWNFAALFPDGKSFIGSYGGTLTRYLLSTTATPAGTVPLPSGALGGTHPNVAPDGSKVVYAYMPRSTCATSYPLDWTTMGDGLAVVAYGASGFGAPTVLVTPDSSCRVNHYYPSFSPDGKWVLFNESSGNTYNNPDATVYLVAAAGGAPVHLVALDTVGSADSWPRWSPFAGSFQGKSINWVTFSSQRAYGNEIAAGTPQIWMAAVAPAGGAPDPSYRPFWLPLQDPTTHNHIAQWTTAVIK